MGPADEASSTPPQSGDVLEARISALADALAGHSADALTREVEQIRAEAADQVAAQCRELASLSRTVAQAEAERETRLLELERELRAALAAAQSTTPRPLDIPRRGLNGGASVTELWPHGDQG